MHANAHFVIGYAHTRSGKPCQDYATAGSLPDDGAYAVVSDGCSSGGQTDVGARLVTLTATQAIRRPWRAGMLSLPSAPEMIAEQQAFGLVGATAALGCAQKDLLATCLYAVRIPAAAFIHIHGDGVVAWQYAGGPLAMERFDWDGNTPSYPAYASDDYAGFVAHHGGDLEAERLTTDLRQQEADGSVASLGTRRLSLGEGMRGVTLPFDDPERLTRLAVFSDGVTQVDGLDWTEVVVSLMGFKTTAGQFATRRLNRFVKDSLSSGHGPIDDLAYAVILQDIEEAP